MTSTNGFFELKSDHLETLKQNLESKTSFNNVAINDDYITAHLNEDLSAKELNKTLFNEGIILTHLVKRKESLEEQFLELTKTTKS